MPSNIIFIYLLISSLKFFLFLNFTLYVLDVSLQRLGHDVFLRVRHGILLASRCSSSPGNLDDDFKPHRKKPILGSRRTVRQDQRGADEEQSCAGGYGHFW